MYNTTGIRPPFVSTVTIRGTNYTGEPKKRKKDAEESAAALAVLAMEGELNVEAAGELDVEAAGELDVEAAVEFS